MKRKEQPYAALSASYDALMTDGLYERRTAFLDRVLKKNRRTVEKVLDLGCGTGTVSWGLARRGYKVIGVDASEEMLAEAAGKAEESRLRGEPPRFLCQSMTKLDPGEFIDAVVSTMDAVNYLTGERELKAAFRQVFRCLEPGGLFVFDVNTPAKLRRMNEQTYTDEAAGTYCVWKTFFTERKKVCTWQVDLFREQEDGSWARSYEEHKERAWEGAELIDALEAAGFGRIRISADLSLRTPGEDEDRWTVLAEKPPEDAVLEEPKKAEKPEKKLSISFGKKAEEPVEEVPEEPAEEPKKPRFPFGKKAEEPVEEVPEEPEEEEAKKPRWKFVKKPETGEAEE